MTDTLPGPATPRSSAPRSSSPGTAGSRALPRPPARSRTSQDLVLTGLPAAAYAALAGLVAVAVPVLLAWIADPRSGSGVGAALRTVAQGWLVAHGTALHLPGGTYDLVPLGLLVLPVLLLRRAARTAAACARVPTLRAAARLTAGVAGPYAVLAGVLAGLARTGEVRPSTGQALLGAGVLAGLGAGSGVLSGAGLWPAARDALPARLVRCGAAATAAVSALLAAGALLVGAALARDVGQAAELARSTAPGVVGGLALLLLGVALAPTAAVWGAGWLAGPGFALGTGTAVGPLETVLGPVPALPLLAALPAGSPPGAVAVLALAVPVLAGVVGGRVVRRRGGGGADAVLAGGFAAVMLGVLCVVGAGPLGDGRLTDVGPSCWQVGLVALLELTAGALVGVLGRRGGAGERTA